MSAENISRNEMIEATEALILIFNNSDLDDERMPIQTNLIRFIEIFKTYREAAKSDYMNKVNADLEALITGTHLTTIEQVHEAFIVADWSNEQIARYIHTIPDLLRRLLYALQNEELERLWNQS